MIEIIGVRFKDGGKVYFFDSNNKKFEKGKYAIVETVRGIEMGEIAISNRLVPEETVVMPLRPVIRAATENDHKTFEENKIKEKEAFSICEEKIHEHNLNMHLVDVEYTFDGSKILFYFTADGRIMINLHNSHIIFCCILLAFFNLLFNAFFPLFMGTVSCVNSCFSHNISSAFDYRLVILVWL